VFEICEISQKVNKIKILRYLTNLKTSVRRLITFIGRLMHFIVQNSKVKIYVVSMF